MSSSTTPLSAPSSLSNEAWATLLRFVELWTAYRDGTVLNGFNSVSWAEVQQQESLMRNALRALPETPDRLLRRDVAAAVVDATLEQELRSLRAQVALLQREIAELSETTQDVSKERRVNAVVDITRTLGYLNAAANAPQDAVHAYRAGMVYAAQVLSRPPMVSR